MRLVICVVVGLGLGGVALVACSGLDPNPPHPGVQPDPSDPGVEPDLLSGRPDGGLTDASGDAP